jgi:hypothetical protein
MVKRGHFTFHNFHLVLRLSALAGLKIQDDGIYPGQLYIENLQTLALFATETDDKPVI